MTKTTKTTTPPARVTHIFANSPIDGQLYSAIDRFLNDGCPDRVVLSLVTAEGNARDAFRIGEMMQARTSELMIHVPGVCRSVGTLLACAGHRVLFALDAEFGPLSVRTTRQNESGVWRDARWSQLAIEGLCNQAIELQASMAQTIVSRYRGAVDYREAAQLAGNVLNGIMSPLVSQLNVGEICDDYIELRAAEEYALQLARGSGGNIDAEGVKRLMYGFPASDFYLDAFDDQHRWFRRMDLAWDALEHSLRNFHKYPRAPLSAEDRIIFKEIIDAPDDDELSNPDFDPGENILNWDYRIGAPAGE